MNQKRKPQVERIKISGMGNDLKNEIDAFIGDNQGTVFHETAFNAISARTFGTDLSYFIARRDGRIAGICPCHQIKDGILLQTYSNLTSRDVVYGGWVYDSGSTDIDELCSQTKIAWNEALHVSSNIELDPANPSKPSTAGYVKEARTAVLRLAGRTDGEIFQGFKHSQKNKIRKAAKLGVRIRQTGPDGMDEFYGLLADLKENLNKEYSPRKYFQDVFSHYSGQGRAACLIAEYEGQNISTLIVLANKAFATIWMGGRKMGIPNNLYQNELMIWEAIKWAGLYGSEYFDLCTVDEERYANLARIKLSFSRDIRPYYHYSKKKLAFRLLNRIQHR